MKLIFIIVFFIIIICAVFNKKKWTSSLLVLNLGIGFSLYGFTEIFEVHETARWAHIIWGFVQFFIAAICLIVFLTGIRKYKSK